MKLSKKSTKGQTDNKNRGCLLFKLDNKFSYTGKKIRELIINL